MVDLITRIANLFREIKPVLQDISRAFPESKVPIDIAEQDYKERCYKNSISPHISKVHTFADTVQQAYVLAIPGVNNEERYNLALLTFYGHLFDDFIDTQKNIAKVLGDFDETTLRERLPSKAAKVMDWMLEIVPDDAMTRTIMGLVYGSLVQQARNAKEQEKYARMFKEYVVGQLRSTPLGNDLEGLHPMQIWLTTHSDMDGWFAVEGNAEIAPLYNLFYAPMLYCHNRKEERRSERFKIRYGKELCEKGNISDKHLIELIDIFDMHIASYPDSRREQHLVQMETVYKAFKPVLSERLQQRYEQSIMMLK